MSTTPPDQEAPIAYYVVDQDGIIDRFSGTMDADGQILNARRVSAAVYHTLRADKERARAKRREDRER